jgi:nucleosome assembly protein 1-like 1
MEVQLADEGIKNDLYYEQRLSKVVMNMPDKFKILKVLGDKKSKTVDHIRKLNLKYEQLKAPLYALRASVLDGEEYPSEYLTYFDQKHDKLKKDVVKEGDDDEEESEGVKVNVDDLVEQKGVPGFWGKVLKAHDVIRDYIKKHDEPILKHITDISGQHFPDRHGYEIVFTFNHNEYMENTELRKVYHMIDDRILEKTEGTHIVWKEGKNPTIKKVKKKQKNKKTGEVRSVTKVVDQESLFNFFKSKSMPESDKLDQMEKEEREELATKLDEDFDLGNDIINEVIPEALEYYLGVVEDKFSDLDSNSEEEDVGEGENDEDEEENNEEKEEKPATPEHKTGDKDNVE